MACAVPHCEDLDTARTPWWALLHASSVDAALVAMAWEALFAKVFVGRVNAAVVLAAGACVWMIYAGDHLMDVRRGASGTLRHDFVARHREGVMAMLGVVAIAGVALTAWFPERLVVAGCALGAVVVAYLGVEHWMPRTWRRYWPKEVVSGAIFALGASVAAWSERPHQVWVGVSLLAGLCILNCAGLDYLDWKREGGGPVPNIATMWLGSNVVAVSVAVAALGVVSAAAGVAPVLGWTAAVSALLLALVTAVEERLQGTVLRMACDAAVLVPAVVALVIAR